ncbi:MAG: NrfD/PsrC family molybdoenzyme membrane anchor subunit [Burkholderiaceae bacterium]
MNMRAEAMQTGRPPAAAVERYDGPSYYGQPAVKASNYGALVWSYTFIAGLSGAAQIIASVADLGGRSAHARMIRNGRYIAVAGAAAGAALLVADLHTPQRWYNMLRIFRPTSPMSIGTGILSGFAGFSGLAALAQFFSRPGRRWPRRLARVAQVPAALTGAGMTFYTGALLAATSTPLWAAAPRLLSARFASSAMATAAAALSLAENQFGTSALDRLTALSAAAGSALSAAADANQARQGLAGASDMDAGTAGEDALARHLGHTLPLACYCLGMLLPARRQRLSRVAALGVLAGGLLMRAAIFRAGNQSAREPRAYLGLTKARPRNPEEA